MLDSRCGCGISCSVFALHTTRTHALLSCRCTSRWGRPPEPCVRCAPPLGEPLPPARADRCSAVGRRDCGRAAPRRTSAARPATRDRASRVRRRPGPRSTPVARACRASQNAQNVRYTRPRTRVACLSRHSQLMLQYGLPHGYANGSWATSRAALRAARSTVCVHWPSKAAASHTHSCSRGSPFSSSRSSSPLKAVVASGSCFSACASFLPRSSGRSGTSGAAQPST